MSGPPDRLVPIGLVHAPILARVHALTFPANEQWNEDAFALLIASPGAGGVATPDGRGFALARRAADEAEILTLAVIPGARRQGLGATLLTAAGQWATDAGARAMFLEVSANNAAAIALYNRGGFRGVGRRRQYYADGADALVMRKDL